MTTASQPGAVNLVTLVGTKQICMDDFEVAGVSLCLTSATEMCCKNTYVHQFVQALTIIFCRCYKDIPVLRAQIRSELLLLVRAAGILFMQSYVWF